MKTCSKCKLTQFPVNFTAEPSGRYKDGLSPWCKECKRQYQREHPYKRDPEYHAKYYQANKRKANEAVKRYTKRLRDLVIEIYGNKCACCNESRGNFLTFEHRLGGGNKHRQRVGRCYVFWKAIIEEGYRPDKYSVLCYNCNCSRGSYGYCCILPINDVLISSHL